MVVDQLAITATLLGILVVAGNGPDLLVPIIALFAGITFPVSFGGFTSLIPVLVPDDLLDPANALEATSFNLALVVGPALAGTLSALLGPEAPLIVQAALSFSTAILDAAALGFLGMGAQPPTPEWGTMLAEAREFILRAWWVVTFPGLAILITVLAINLVGDGLRDALDPKLKRS